MNTKKQKLNLTSITEKIVPFLDQFLCDLYLYRKMRRGVWHKYQDTVICGNDCIVYSEWVRSEELREFGFSDFFGRIILKTEDHRKNESA